ncbi:MAG: hypothetical protein ABUT20_37370 [Bacteroidota bacterium]
MMKAINEWLEQNAPDDSTVALHTPENLEMFYKQFDFYPSFSMIKMIERKGK